MNDSNNPRRFDRQMAFPIEKQWPWTTNCSCITISPPVVLLSDGYARPAVHLTPEKETSQSVGNACAVLDRHLRCQMVQVTKLEGRIIFIPPRAG